MLQTDRDNLELDKLQAETRRLAAETRKFMAEENKLKNDSFWYPVVVGAGLITAFTAAAGLWTKL
jgi:hypothetical protein